MSRLSKSIRDDIVMRVRRKVTEPRLKAAAEARDAIIKEVANALVPAEVWEFTKNERLKPYLNTTTYVRFSCPGIGVVSTHIDNAIPARTDRNDVYVVSDEGLQQRLQHFWQWHENEREECRKIAMQVETMLERFGSPKQLREGWPQGKEFYEDLLPEPTAKTNVPAVMIDEVNALLGLTPKEEADGEVS